MNKNFEFVEKLPGLVIAKDLDSTYLHISQTFAELLGWKSARECQGKTDHDIRCKAAEFADEFVKIDKVAMESQKRMLALDIQHYSSGWRLVLAERNPLIDETGKTTGLFNQCIDVTDSPFFKHYLHLHQLDRKLTKTSKKPVSYILTDVHSPLQLTEKQEYCLFLLIRGKCVKEIAKILGISPRTVEDHIQAIKNKLNCQYQSEIIEKAINSGFLYYVPTYLQQYDLKKIAAKS